MNSFDQSLERLTQYHLIKVGDTSVTVLVLLELLLMFALVILGQWVLRRYVFPPLLRRTRFDPALQLGIAKIAGYVLMILGFWISLQVAGLKLRDIGELLDYRLIKLGTNYLTLEGLIELLVMLAVVFVAEAVLRRYLITRLLRRTRFNPSLQFAIAKITGYAFIALGFYISLQVVGLNLTSLAFLAGAVGVGLGFGLQNIVHNFVSGLIILAERPIAMGDRIEVGGVAGQVKQIRLRSTTVVTNDNIAYIVPNSDFITHTVINWSHGDLRVRIRLPVSVAYGTDTRKFERLLLDVALANPKVLREPGPSVFFKGFGESALDFELAVWTMEMTFQPRRFRSDLYYAIEETLRENKIEIPFPQRDLHLRSGTIVQAASKQ